MKIKRSPLKDRPLRNPGQSLDEQIQDLTYDYMVWPMLFALFLVLIAALEWFRYFRPQSPSPLIYTVGAVAGLGFAGYRLYHALPRLHALKQGRDGEKVVGQFLETLRERGYRVFHDVVGEGFNVDHVLISPASIFTVETKTYSKAPGRRRVRFDGETILVDGFAPDRDLLVQAKAQANWIGGKLTQSTGRKYTVRSAIVFPEWFVDYTGPRERSIWVLNPKALPAFLAHSPEQLSREAVELASFHLSRFIQATEVQ